MLSGKPEAKIDQPTGMCSGQWSVRLLAEGLQAKQQLHEESSRRGKMREGESLSTVLLAGLRPVLHQAVFVSGGARYAEAVCIRSTGAERGLLRQQDCLC